MLGLWELRTRLRRTTRADAGVAQTSSDPSTVVILVDQLFVSPISRGQVFESLSERLEDLIDSGTRILVAGKKRDVSVEQDFTSNLAMVRAALDRLSDAAPDRLRRRDQNHRRVVESASLCHRGPAERTGAANCGPPDVRDGCAIGICGRSGPQPAASRRHNRQPPVSASVSRFPGRPAGAQGSDLCRRPAAGSPGRAAVAHLVAEVRPRARLQVRGDGHRTRGSWNLSRAVEELISDANASRVAFYPVGADSRVDLAGAASRGLSGSTQSGLRTAESASADGLIWLSERSGGRSAVGGGDFGMFLDDLERDLATYYSHGLRVAPTPAMDKSIAWRSESAGPASISGIRSSTGTSPPTSG